MHTRPIAGARTQHEPICADEAIEHVRQVICGGVQVEGRCDGLVSLRVHLFELGEVVHVTLAEDVNLNVDSAHLLSLIHI